MYGPRNVGRKILSGRAGKRRISRSAGHAGTFCQGARRRNVARGWLLVPDLTLTVRGDAIVASFTLSKGAFATVVMRELMKVDDDHLSVIAEDDE